MLHQSNILTARKSVPRKGTTSGNSTKCPRKNHFSWWMWMFCNLGSGDISLWKTIWNSLATPLQSKWVQNHKPLCGGLTQGFGSEGLRREGSAVVFLGILGCPTKLINSVTLQIFHTTCLQEECRKIRERYTEITKQMAQTITYFIFAD